MPKAKLGLLAVIIIPIMSWCMWIVTGCQSPAPAPTDTPIAPAPGTPMATATPTYTPIALAAGIPAPEPLPTIALPTPTPIAPLPVTGAATARSTPMDTPIVPPPHVRVAKPTPTVAPPKFVFVSSSTYTGNLGGLEGADARCQDLAKSAGLRGTYKAWLSDATQSPSTRFTHHNGPYILVDGTILANNWADLTDGNLAHPMHTDENGTERSDRVWTATWTDGTTWRLLGAHCKDWTYSQEQDYGGYGWTYESGSEWTAVESTVCSHNFRLYCFEM